MRCIGIILLNFCLAGYARAQNSVEFQIAHVQDKTFNVIGHEISMYNPPFVDNRYTIASHFRYEHGISSVVSGIIGLRLTSRKFNYNQPGQRIHDFMHNTIELPVGLRFRKKILENLSIKYDLEGGMNYVITSDQNSRAGDLYGNYFQFSAYNKPAYFLQSGLGFETKISQTNYLSFFIAYQYQFTPLFRYRAYNEWFDSFGPDILTHNLSTGIAFRFAGKQ